MLHDVLEALRSTSRHTFTFTFLDLSKRTVAAARGVCLLPRGYGRQSGGAQPLQANHAHGAVLAIHQKGGRQDRDS